MSSIPSCNDVLVELAALDLQEYNILLLVNMLICRKQKTEELK